MSLEEKLHVLGSAAKYDVCAASSCTANTSGPLTGLGSLSSSPVCHSFTPDGRCVSLFKVLQTNICKNNCRYCFCNCSQDIRRMSFSPEELAQTFIEFYKRNYVEGLFLSSGIKSSANQTMEEMLKTVEIIRKTYRYRGYVHLKVLPGSTPDVIEAAARLATRLSVNMEAPNPERLQLLAPNKNMQTDILRPMSLIARAQQNGMLPAGQTTQFVVGAAGETDREIIDRSVWLYETQHLKRVYFSAFVNSEDHLSRESLLREHRLYQTDFLYRKYKFTREELLVNNDGHLDLDIDPKLALAIQKVGQYPLEVNRASYDQLLRIPGIGPLSARRIIRIRKEYRFSNLQELKNMGIATKRAAPFLTINGKKQGSLESILQRPKQLCFDFTERQSLSTSPALIPALLSEAA